MNTSTKFVIVLIGLVLITELAFSEPNVIRNIVKRQADMKGPPGGMGGQSKGGPGQGGPGGQGGPPGSMGGSAGAGAAMGASMGTSMGGGSIRLRKDTLSTWGIKKQQ